MMNSLKDQAARIAGRGDRLSTTFDDIAARDRDLQDQVNALGAALAELRIMVDEQRDQIVALQAANGDLVDSYEATRRSMRSVVDDLGDRIGAITTRLDEPGR